MSNTNVKVHLANTGTCITFSTYSRHAGKRGRFFVVTKNLLEWLTDEKRSASPFYDSDCGSFVSMRLVEHNWLLVRFTWLSHGSDRKITGISESFYIALLDIACVLEESGMETDVLCCDEEWGGVVRWTPGAQENIRHMNQPVRRALSKAMARGALIWPSTVTQVYADGPNDFYFRTNDGLCGGLILHKYTGKYGTAYKYSVHT